ncbi:hypothetical protein ACLMJK_001333 [Lecanora helva]
MAKVTDLPNEIICNILDNVRPEDLESCTQISKHVLRVCEPYLQRHRDLIRTYHKLIVPDFIHETPGNAVICSKLPKVLRNVLLDNRLGFYVKTLVIINEEPDEVAEIEEESEVQTQRSRLGPLQCIHLPGVDECTMVTEWLRGGGQDGFLPLLIPLLPGLTTLAIHWSFYDYGRLLDEIEYMISNPVSVLSNLVSVQLSASYEVKILLKMVALFAALPSVRVLRAQQTQEQDLIWSDICQRSNVAEIVLQESGLRPTKICEMIQSFLQLESFHYVLSSGHPSLRLEGQDFCSMRDMLLECAGTTLRELSLTSRRQSERYVGSLRDFEVLESLTIDWNALLPPAISERTLEKLLPASLRSLSIRETRQQNCEQCCQLFKALNWAKSVKLRRLERITLILYKLKKLWGMTFFTNWKQELEKVGFNLETLSAEHYARRQRRHFFDHPTRGEFKFPKRPQH